MEKDEIKRTQLEDAIIAKFSVIQRRDIGRDDPIWLNFDQWDDFLDLCHDLFHYYEDHADTVIGVEVVRVYADLTRYLRLVKSSDKLNQEQRFDLDDKLAEIEVWMDDIISQAAKNWEHLNTESEVSIDYRQYLKLLPALRQSPTDKISLSYDEKADELSINFRNPSDANNGELTDDDVIVRYEGDDVIGITILRASKR
jgi:uncharacterized protein YuzE